jgi:hypothetical protein
MAEIENSESSVTIPEADAAAMRRGEKPYYEGQGAEDEPVPGLEEKAEASPDESANDPAEPGADADTDPEEKPKEGDEPAEDFSSLYEGWTQEFAKTGELSEESNKTILDKIFHPDLTDAQKQELLTQYTGGIRANDDLSTLEGWTIAGGREAYDGMIAWASTNLSEAEAKQFNADLNDRDRATAAIKGLNARYQQAGGYSNDEPDLTHNAAAAHGEPPIASRQQLKKIVMSEQYQNDPAYRERVNQQLSRAMKSEKYRTF